MAVSLFKPKAEIEVRIGETCLLPGATIPVEVAVCPAKQLNPREIRLELMRTEAYYMAVTSGRYAPTARRRTTIESTKVCHHFKDQPSFPSGIMSSRKLNIQVPLDATPSSRGMGVDVSWTLRATLDLPGRSDLMQEVPVQVMSNPISARTNVTDLPLEKSYKDCILNLEVPNTIMSNEAVSGHLQVKVLRRFQVSGIRMELIQIEDVFGSKKITNVVAQQDLSGTAFLNTTDLPSFDFSLPLPPNASPTVVTRLSSLRWQVRAILDRRIRPNFTIEQDVFIYSTHESKV